MSISQPLVLNAPNEIDVGDFRLNNEEWSIDIDADEDGVLLFVDDSELEEDEDVDSDLWVYVVDEEHDHIVEEWVRDHRTESLETQTAMPHLNLDLKTSIEFDGVQYSIYIMYSAD